MVVKKNLEFGSPAVLVILIYCQKPRYKFLYRKKEVSYSSVTVSLKKAIYVSSLYYMIFFSFLDELLANVTIMGAYVYAIFSMIASGMYLHTMKTKPIIVFVQSFLLFVQVSFQGKIEILDFFSWSFDVIYQQVEIGTSFDLYKKHSFTMTSEQF